MRPLAFLILLCGGLYAQELPEVDQRHSSIRHTDSVFEMPEYSSAAEWQDRAADLRRQILWSAGLDPLPERTDLAPRISEPIQRDGYTIENVLLETSPGFYLGGNLYRPANPSELGSAVVLSHGHWTYGRLENSDTASPPTLAANLALQGHVTFTYDMIGYNDTAQLPHEDIRKRGAVLWSHNLLGLQLWNSIRALDFLQSIDGVNPQHLYAAGASGGATQAMLLSATDDRISAVALVNMISFHMQGGDVCENAPGLRVGTSNVELTALIAPRPLLLVSSTGDWTANTPRAEFPALRSLYHLLGDADRVQNVHQVAPHNFNQTAREAVYTFFDSQKQTIDEQSVSIPQPSELLTLWGSTYPSNWTNLTLRTVNSGHANSTLPTPERLQLALKVNSSSEESLRAEITETWRNGEFFAVGRTTVGDRVPGVLLTPRRVRAWVKPTLIIHPEGSAWTMSSAESRDGYVSNVLSRGGSVMAVDVFQTGHAITNIDIAAAGPHAEEFFTTFNRTDTAERVQDVLTAIAYARQRFATDHIQLICPGTAGLWCAFARAFIDGPLDSVIDWDQFDEASDNTYLEKAFVPGIRKAGGLPAAVEFWSGGRSVVFNSNSSFPLSADADVPITDLRVGDISEWEGLLEWTAPRRRPK